MRKNGVNRELKEIVGGVCASDGFFASAVPIEKDKNAGVVSRETISNRLGVITSDGRYPFAFQYRDGKVVGACNKVMDRYLKGYTRAILFYGKETNLTGEEAENQAIELTRAFSRVAKICPDEIGIACTGAIDRKFSIQPLTDNMKSLFAGVSRVDGVSSACAQVIACGNQSPLEFSYSFYIGDIPCKIGGIFNDGKGGEALLCMMTTDVKITPDALKRALSTAISDSFNSLDLGGQATPDDCIMITASGKAGNYVIDRADSEYDKFVYALTSAMQKVCDRIIENYGKIFYCRVQKGSSKRTVKRIAEAVMRARLIHGGLKTNNLSAQEILSAIHSSGEAYDFGKMEIVVKADDKEIVVYEERDCLLLSVSSQQQIHCAKKVELILRLNDGNYSVTKRTFLG